MRSLIVLLLVGLAAWYFTIGIRFGLVTEWPTQIFNGNGTSTYEKEIFTPKYPLNIRGTCNTLSGKLTIRVLTPSRQVLASTVCTKGPKNVSINLVPGVGKYPLELKFERYFGSIDVR
ncbi:MAG: hypothetical protein U0Z75_03405 [Deinococcaceae bacterium]